MNTQDAFVARIRQAHQEELETITQLLANITHRTPAQIQPHLDAMLQQLVQPAQEFYQQATPEEWVTAFKEWVDSHRQLNLPTLSNEAISRDSIYGDRG